MSWITEMLPFAFAGLVLILSWLLRARWQAHGQPPGPWGLPVLGQFYNLTLSGNNILNQLKIWKELYGPVYQFNVLGQRVLVIHGYKRILEQKKREVLQGRPPFEMFKIRNVGGLDTGILLSSRTTEAISVRRATLKIFKDLGFGNTKLDDLLIHEANDLIQELRKQNDQAQDVLLPVFRAVFNTLWYLTTGKRFNSDSQEFLDLTEASLKHSANRTLFNIGLFGLSLVKILKPALMDGFRKKMELEIQQIESIIFEHTRSYNSEACRDFIDYFIQHTQENAEEKTAFTPRQVQQLRVIMMDIFSGGNETTGSTLTYGLYYACLYPEIQKRLQTELDKMYLGNVNSVAWHDREKLPYVCAFIAETHRKASIAPLGVYSYTMEDCEVEGFLVKKDTVVAMNLYDVHHDPEVWGDPENFRPERFLDANGRFLNHDALMPFSSGKRQCPGEILARQTLFIFICALFQSLQFEIDEASKTVIPESPKNSLVNCPTGLKFKITPRKACT